jgi:hypothetical protein
MPERAVFDEIEDRMLGVDRRRRDERSDES